MFREGISRASVLGVKGGDGGWDGQTYPVEGSGAVAQVSGQVMDLRFRIADACHKIEKLSDRLVGSTPEQAGNGKTSPEPMSEMDALRMEISHTFEVVERLHYHLSRLSVL